MLDIIHLYSIINYNIVILNTEQNDECIDFTCFFIGILRSNLDE